MPWCSTRRWSLREQRRGPPPAHVQRRLPWSSAVWCSPSRVNLLEAGSVRAAGPGDGAAVPALRATAARRARCDRGGLPGCHRAGQVRVPGASGTPAPRTRGPHGLRGAAPQDRERALELADIAAEALSDAGYQNVTLDQLGNRWRTVALLERFTRAEVNRLPDRFTDLDRRYGPAIRTQPVAPSDIDRIRAVPNAPRFRRAELGPRLRPQVGLQKNPSTGLSYRARNHSIGSDRASPMSLNLTSVAAGVMFRPLPPRVSVISAPYGGSFKVQMHDPNKALSDLRDHLARHDKPIAFLFGAGTSCSVRVPDPNDNACTRPLIPAVCALTQICKDKGCSLGQQYAKAWEAIESHCEHLGQDPNVENILSRLRVMRSAVTSEDMLSAFESQRLWHLKSPFGRQSRE